jgi:hypothetical protein
MEVDHPAIAFLEERATGVEHRLLSDNRLPAIVPTCSGEAT